MRVTRRLRILLAAVGLLLLCGGAAVAAGRFDSEQALRNFLFGPKLVRAEIVVRDAQGLHDYRIDRGRVLRVRADAILLRERDAPRVRVRVDGAVVALSSVVRGMVATTVRDGESPATQLLARER